MKAIFIAAGSGSRLGNLTQNTPKPLIEIHGKSILQRGIETLREVGINEISVIVGPLAEKFVDKTLEYFEDKNYSKHDQLGSLMCANKNIFGDVLILFADILFDKKIISKIINTSGDFVLAVDADWKKSYEYRQDNPISEADKVVLENNSIIKIGKNILHQNESLQICEFLGIMKLTSIGCKIFTDTYHKLEQSHNGKFHDASSFSFAKIIDILQEINISGNKLTAVIIDGLWCEIDTPLDLERAKKLFKPEI